MKRIDSGLAAPFLGAILVALASAQAVEAQSYLMPATPEKGFWLEATHPDVKIFDDLDLTVASSAWFLSGRHPVAGRFHGVVEVPFAYGDVDVKGGSGLSGRTVLGNPYVGAKFALDERFTFEAGLRIPVTTADETSFGDVVGVFADVMRMEAFMMDVLPISVAANFRQTLPNGLALRFRGGVTPVIWTGDSDEGDTFTLLDYGAFVQYPVGRARLGGGVAGRWDVTEDDGDFSENSLHHLGVSADYAFGRFRPGINVRVPVDSNYRDVVSSSVGFYVQMALR